MWFREENIKISENLLIFPNEFGIITNGVWRDVRAGRRSMIGNHVYGNHRTRGSNPLLSAKVAPVAYASGVRFLFAFLVNVMKRVLVLLIIISLLLFPSVLLTAKQRGTVFLPSMSARRQAARCARRCLILHMIHRRLIFAARQSKSPRLLKQTARTDESDLII